MEDEQAKSDLDVPAGEQMLGTKEPNGMSTSSGHQAENTNPNGDMTENSNGIVTTATGSAERQGDVSESSSTAYTSPRLTASRVMPDLAESMPASSLSSNGHLTGGSAVATPLTASNIDLSGISDKLRIQLAAKNTTNNDTEGQKHSVLPQTNEGNEDMALVSPLEDSTRLSGSKETTRPMRVDAEVRILSSQSPPAQVLLSENEEVDELEEQSIVNETPEPELSRDITPTREKVTLEAAGTSKSGTELPLLSSDITRKQDGPIAQQDIEIDELAESSEDEPIVYGHAGQSRPSPGFESIEAGLASPPPLATSDAGPSLSQEQVGTAYQYLS